jgi:two-component system alkaline phosphatase synthesis response regulator PhoP
MSSPSVLIIDDERDVADLTRYVLQRSGFDASAAYSPEDGFAQAQNNHPDVIICDIAMPHFSGLEILRKLKANAATAHIPVILMSGADRFDCAGMFTFLLKPLDATSLLSAIRSALACGKTPSPPSLAT